LTLPLQDHPPLQRDSIETDTARETENIAIETETLITGTLVTVTIRRIIGTATETLAVVEGVVVGTRARLCPPPPRLVTTPTLVGLGAVDDTNTIETGRETMIVGTGMDIVAEGGARTVIAITLPLAMCTIPKGNTRRGEGATVAAVDMAIAAGRREEDMEVIEVVGVAVGVVTGEETGADSLSLEVGGV
jgi:hypothetical protein